MPKTPRRSSKAKGTRNTAVPPSTSAARSTSAAGRQNVVPSDAGCLPSDSIASLSLATLLEAVSERVRAEMARATPNVESAVAVEGQAGAPAQGQALATGESTYSTEVFCFNG